MNIKTIFYMMLMLLILLLSACANLQQSGHTLTTNGSIVPKIWIAKPATPLKSHIKKRTNFVFNTLAADIAVQRGQYKTATRHYTKAAQIGRNSVIAGLATQSAMEAGHYKTAQKRVAYWLSLAPRSTKALQTAIKIAIQTNDITKVTIYLQRLIVVKNAAGKNGYLAAVAMLNYIEDPATRSTLGHRIITGHRYNHKAMLALAVLETQMGNFSQAEVLTRRVLRKRPNSNKARILLVNILKANRDFNGARTTLEGFVADDPNNITLRNLYAQMLLDQNDLANAQLQFQHLYQANPRDANSLFALGMIALHLGQRDAGQRYLEDLYALGSHQDEAAFYIGQIFEEEAKYEKALNWYVKVENRNHVEAQVRMARIYAQRGAIPRTQEILQQVRGRLDGNTSHIDLLEAEILREVKQYKLAFKVLTHAVKHNPHNHDLLYARALTGIQLGKLHILEQDLKQIIAQDPNHIEALNALGYTLATETTRYAEALTYIQRAYAIQPNNPAILDSMGWIQYRMGHPEKALPYLRKALALQQDPEIAAHLGEVLWHTGKQDEARKVWRDALHKAPASEYILKMQELYGVRF